MLDYLRRFCCVILIAAPFYLLFRRPWARVSAGKSVLPRELAMACFVLFHAGLLTMALEGEYASPAVMAERAAGRLAAGEGINLAPFRTISSFFPNGDSSAHGSGVSAGPSNGSGVSAGASNESDIFTGPSDGGGFHDWNADAFMVNIVGNVVMFMPWGFGIVLLWESRRKALWIGAYSLLLPLFIETSQLFIGRSVDVDDLILNFMGSILGAGGFFLLRSIRKKIPAGRKKRNDKSYDA